MSIFDGDIILFACVCIYTQYIGLSAVRTIASIWGAPLPTKLNGTPDFITICPTIRICSMGGILQDWGRHFTVIMNSKCMNNVGYS